MIILSILIPTIPERSQMFYFLKSEVIKQVDKLHKDHETLGQVEIVWDDSVKFLDGGLSIGKKRESLVNRAGGKYLCFLDDDELIAPNYVETLVRLCQYDRDVCTFKNITKLDNFWCLVDMSLYYPGNDPASPSYIVRRRPWHICPVKSEHAKRHHFEDSNYSEDFTWMERVLNHCTSEAKSEAVIHQYNHSKLVSEADKNIILRTADAVVQKVQIAVKLGKVEGYAKALGSNTVKFFSINPNLSLHEIGIFISDALTEEQKQMLWQDINIKESQGLLDVGDKYFLMNARNTAMAYQTLAYKIQKRKEEQQAFALQQQQAASEGNIQVTQAAEQMKQQTIQLQLEADLIRINAQGQWTYETEMMKKQTDLQGEIIQSEARNVGHQIQSEAKVIAQRISAETAIEKQKIANQKPNKPVSKK